MGVTAESYKKLASGPLILDSIFIGEEYKNNVFSCTKVGNVSKPDYISDGLIMGSYIQHFSDFQKLCSVLFFDVAPSLSAVSKLGCSGSIK